MNKYWQFENINARGQTRVGHDGAKQNGNQYVNVIFYGPVWKELTYNYTYIYYDLIVKITILSLSEYAVKVERGGG